MESALSWLVMWYGPQVIEKLVRELPEMGIEIHLENRGTIAAVLTKANIDQDECAGMSQKKARRYLRRKYGREDDRSVEVYVDEGKFDAWKNGQ